MKFSPSLLGGAGRAWVAMLPGVLLWGGCSPSHEDPTAGGSASADSTGSEAASTRGSPTMSSAEGSTALEPGTVGSGEQSQSGDVRPTVDVSPPPEPLLQPTADCTQPGPEVQCEGEFCRIEAGCFVMGAPRDEWAIGKYADRQVQVRLTRAFELGRTELTRAQWQAEELALPTRHNLAGEGDCSEPDCPVTNVSFFDSIAFANRYSERRGLEPCYRLTECSGALGVDLTCEGIEASAESVYACEGYRLPTEAEWEYAVRGGTTSAFFTGGITPQEHRSFCREEPSLVPIGWYCYNSGGRPHPVAQKQANPWGLYDVAGNVFEWCNDIYDGGGYGEGPLVDPTGTRTPTSDLNPPLEKELEHGRVLRGSNHVSWASLAKSSTRHYLSQHIADTGVGLRLARTLRKDVEVPQ